MTDLQDVRLHCIVEGQVQGVGFRAFVQDQAIRLGLTGWVRNRWDGAVEVTAEGRKDQLEKLLTVLYRGPRLAYVSGLIPEWDIATGEFSGFRVKSTSG